MIKVSNNNLLVVQKLINSGAIPEEGNFSITEDLLLQHRELYKSLGGGNSNNFLKSRRYAGLGLLYLKKFRKIPAKDIPEGFVYLISNPAWPSKTKIGLAVDLNKRLQSYQTYDPYRSYKIVSYEFVLNKKEVERHLLKYFSTEKDLGEWVSDLDAEFLIQKVRSDIRILNENNLP